MTSVDTGGRIGGHPRKPPNWQSARQIASQSGRHKCNHSLNHITVRQAQIQSQPGRHYDSTQSICVQCGFLYLIAQLLSCPHTQDNTVMHTCTQTCTQRHERTHAHKYASQANMRANMCASMHTQFEAHLMSVTSATSSSSSALSKTSDSSLHQAAVSSRSVPRADPGPAARASARVL